MENYKTPNLTGPKFLKRFRQLISEYADFMTTKARKPKRRRLEVWLSRHQQIDVPNRAQPTGHTLIWLAHNFDTRTRSNECSINVTGPCSQHLPILHHSRETEPKHSMLYLKSGKERKGTRTKIFFVLTEPRNGNDIKLSHHDRLKVKNDKHPMHCPRQQSLEWCENGKRLFKSSMK